jgi:hypothetical protein
MKSYRADGAREDTDMQTATETEATTDRRSAEHVQLNYANATSACGVEIGEIYTLESSVSRGIAFPRRLRGTVLAADGTLPGWFKLDLDNGTVVYESGVFGCDLEPPDAEMLCVADEELARMRRIYGWRRRCEVFAAFASG